MQTSTKDRIEELEGKIAAKCLYCHKLRHDVGVGFHCGRRRSKCHLKTVQRWLKEIDELRSAPSPPFLRREEKRTE